MSVDTKVILYGAPSAEEVAAAIRSAFSIEAAVTTTSVDEMFHVTFPDPAGRLAGYVSNRSLSVFPDDSSSDDRDVYSGRRTLCMLGASGGAVMVADALASRFGGYVLENDSRDDWRLVEPVSGETPDLTAEDVLKIEIAKIVGNRDATFFAALVDEPDKLERLVAAYLAYRSAKSDFADSPAVKP